MPRQDASGPLAVAPLQRIDDLAMLCDQGIALRADLAAADTDGDQTIELLDQVNRGLADAAVGAQPRNGEMKFTIVSHEARRPTLLRRGEPAHRTERVEAPQRLVAGLTDHTCGASRLEHRAEIKQVARIRNRDRRGAIALSRSDNDEAFRLQSQQRVAYRRTGDRKALGDLGVPDLGAGRDGAAEDLPAQGAIDIRAHQLIRNFVHLIYYRRHLRAGKLILFSTQF